MSLSRISRNAPAADLLEPGENLVEMGPDKRFDGNEAMAQAPGSRGTAAGSAGSSAIRRQARALPRRRSKTRLKPPLGMNGNGCDGSIACGVRTGNICSRKWSPSHIGRLASVSSVKHLQSFVRSAPREEGSIRPAARRPANPPRRRSPLAAGSRSFHPRSDPRPPRN